MLTVRRALAGALLAQIAVSISEQGIPSLAGFVKQNLGLSASVSGVIVSSILIGEVIASYAAGALADRIGARSVMSLSTIGAGALIIVASALPPLGVVLLLMCAGLAIAAVTPAGARLILTSSPRRRLGTLMGIRQSGVPVGGLAAALLLPAVAATEGWRAGVAVAGVLTFVGGLAALASSGLEPRSQVGRAVRLERTGRVAAPRDRRLALATVWACLLVSGQYVVLAFLGLSIHSSSGLSLARASIFVAVAQLGGIGGRIGWGYVVDRLLGGDAKTLLTVLSGVAFIVAILFGLLPNRAPLVLLVLLSLAAGLSLLGWQGVWIMYVSELDGATRVGRSIGFALTFVNLAAFSAAPAFGLVFDISHSFKTMWLAAGAVLALVLLPLTIARSGPAEIASTSAS